MHIPVLLQEVLTILNPEPNEDVIDATINGGGHAEALLERIAPNGKLLGIDRDPSILAKTRERLAKFEGHFIAVRGNFSHIEEIAVNYGVLHPSCILFDLGTSSYHLVSGRGFSFRGSEPLDMRFDSEEHFTAGAIINHASPEELLHIFETYGEERKARHLVDAIISERKQKNIETTADLVRIIEKHVPRSKIHPATRIFQALRIAVNNELDFIRKGIEAAYYILDHRGRLAVISFHSLEDRIVKNFFKEAEGGSILTPKPIVASREEQLQNPRSRSAKLRAIQKF